MKNFKKFLIVSLLFLMNTTKVMATEAVDAAPVDEKSLVGKFLILIVGVILISLVLFISYKMDKGEEEAERKEKIVARANPKKEVYEENRVVTDKNVAEADVNVDDISEVDADLFDAMMKDEMLEAIEETEKNIDNKIQEFSPSEDSEDSYDGIGSDDDIEEDDELDNLLKETEDKINSLTEEDDDDEDSFMYEIVDAEDLEDDYAAPKNSETVIFDTSSMRDTEAEEHDEEEYEEKKEEVEYEDDDLSDLEAAIQEANTSRFTRKKDETEEVRRPSRVYTHMRKAVVATKTEKAPAAEVAKEEKAPEKPKRAKRGTKAFEMTEVKERPKRGRKPGKKTAKKTTTKKTTKKTTK